ncbi:hypothetical protein BC832DRAFT_426912 [Gaertneriomyces semiglobifer]|nr:hypothetical protein BC832DRAFT_426912 [Gaertneriomyces semiglobifer]
MNKGLTSVQMQALIHVCVVPSYVQEMDLFPQIPPRDGVHVISFPGFAVQIPVNKKIQGPVPLLRGHLFLQSSQHPPERFSQRRISLYFADYSRLTLCDNNVILCTVSSMLASRLEDRQVWLWRWTGGCGTVTWAPASMVIATLLLPIWKCDCFSPRTLFLDDMVMLAGPQNKRAWI